MKTNYLLPNQFKKIGWIIFIPVLILGLLWVIFEFEPAAFDIKTVAIFKGKFLDNIQFIAITENNTVTPLPYHGSAHINAMCSSAGLISIPACIKEIKKGQTIDVRQI